MGASFSIARLPRVEAGPGAIAKAPSICARFGRRMLLVTGAHSFGASVHHERLAAALRKDGFAWETLAVDGEPSPELVDAAVRAHRAAGIEVVLGIGGGSALDAAKAIAGLLKTGGPVLDHLEGVGRDVPYRGPSVPYVAVPTTAGTGSEATKNAVLSTRGKGGFKKSFRDEQLVPQDAILDPDLLASCPPALIAADGMDALTQLLEAYVSAKASPFTDAFAEGGMRAARDGLVEWYERGAAAGAARASMQWAAYASGVVLAHAGLGAVHGLASPLGAFFPAPHGAVCGTLVAAATEANVNAMLSHDPSNAALKKYAAAGRLLASRPGLDDAAARKALVEWLYDLTDRLKLPRLGTFGISANDLPGVVAHCRGGSMKTNPIVLTDEELTAVLTERL